MGFAINDIYKLFTEGPEDVKKFFLDWGIDDDDWFGDWSVPESQKGNHKPNELSLESLINWFYNNDGSLYATTATFTAVDQMLHPVLTREQRYGRQLDEMGIPRYQRPDQQPVQQQPPQPQIEPEIILLPANSGGNVQAVGVGNGGNGGNAPIQNPINNAQQPQNRPNIPEQVPQGVPGTIPRNVPDNPAPRAGNFEKTTQPNNQLRQQQIENTISQATNEVTENVQVPKPLLQVEYGTVAGAVTEAVDGILQADYAANLGVSVARMAKKLTKGIWNLIQWQKILAKIAIRKKQIKDEKEYTMISISKIIIT